MIAANVASGEHEWVEIQAFMEYIVLEEIPAVAEYNALRKSCEWPVYDDKTVARALSNTLFSVVARDGSGRAVGMGRIVGDGAIYVHIQDVIVDPAYQRMGIGKMIMNKLMTYVDTVAGSNTNIGLMCSKGREKFYADLGFIERPNEKFGAGMIMVK